MSSAEIEAAAADWFARKEAEGWTLEQQDELDRWLDRSIAHRIEFLRVCEVWNRFGELEGKASDRTPGAVPERANWAWHSLPKVAERFPVEQLSARGRRVNAATATHEGRRDAAAPVRFFSIRVWTPAAAALAAAVLAAVGLTTWYVAHKGTGYRTQLGQIRSVPLKDGSRATLDTETRIAASVRADERRIDLIQGDAYFEVVKDSTRPFVVSVGRARVVAVGTQFYVERHEDGLIVLVTEGKIRLERPDGAPQEVAAGSEARLYATELRISQPTDLDVEETLGWRNGYLLFRNSSLADAVAKFNRYTQKKMRIEDPSIAQILVGGHFRLDNVQGFLWLLKTGFPIDVDERADRIVLTKRSG